MTKVDIEWQDQFGHWKHLVTKHNERDAFRSAQARAKSTGKRHRLMSEGTLLDILEHEFRLLVSYCYIQT